MKKVIFISISVLLPLCLIVRVSYTPWDLLMTPVPRRTIMKVKMIHFRFEYVYIKNDDYNCSPQSRRAVSTRPLNQTLPHAVSLNYSASVCALYPVLKPIMIINIIEGVGGLFASEFERPWCKIFLNLKRTTHISGAFLSWKKYLQRPRKSSSPHGVVNQVCKSPRPIWY
jgi:hypothetical protein